MCVFINFLGTRSGHQTRKHQRDEDSHPANGNSKRRCVNNSSSTSGRNGTSNTDNTHSGKYCVTFLFFQKYSWSKQLTYGKNNNNNNNKLGDGVCLQGAYHTTLAFHINKVFRINRASLGSPTHTCLIEILLY